MPEKQEDEIKEKLDKDIFWKAIAIISVLFGAIFSLIINLYIYNYSALADIKIDMAVIQTKLETLTTSLNNHIEQTK